MANKRISCAVYNTIISRRTMRSFKSKNIPLNKLKRLVNVARLAPSAANLQPLEFTVINDKRLCGKIFPHLRWAAYIHPQGVPPPGKKPTAYIIVLLDSRRAKSEFFAYDVGAAIENILIAACSEAIGGCWMKSIDKKAISRIVKLPAYIKIDSVVALGYPNEFPRIEKLRSSVKYWKDKRDTLHVPKRSLESIFHLNKYGKS